MAIAKVSGLLTHSLTYPDITSYEHVPGLVPATLLPAQLDGFEEGLHLACLLLQEV